MQYTPATFSKAVSTIANDARTADINGTGVDARGFAQALVIMDLGDLTDAGTLAIKLQESDDNSTFTDITGAAYTVATNADDGLVKLGSVRLHKKGRYLRAVGDGDGTQSHTYGVILLLTDPSDSSLASSTMEFAVL